MGAHLKFRLEDPSRTDEANAFLDTLTAQQELAERDRIVHFWSHDDREWVAEEIGEEYVGTFEDIGEGSIKTSGLPYEHSERITELWAQVFDALQEQFDVEVYSNSCSLGVQNGSFSYFSPDQAARITQNGEMLTGSNIDTVKAHLPDNVNTTGESSSPA